MADIEVVRSQPSGLDYAGPRRRPPPMPPMFLSPLAKAGLWGLRILLSTTTLMAAYAILFAHHS
ncbi:MAG TPA: hypothetical protein VGH03_12705 [Caulobacteraceae bacterium]|jgi:hypothetical protein